jgi:4-hydroxy-tetrahydrodipicolinate synthase
MVAIAKVLEAGRPAEALRIHTRFYPLFRDLFVESNPVPIKHAMSFAGFCEPHVRAPLAALSAGSAEKLQASLRRCGVEKGSRL